MKKSHTFYLLKILCLLLFFPSHVNATGVFPIIDLNEDFNEANLLMNVYNPPNISEECNNQETPCSPQFTLILPQWMRPYPNESTVTIYEPRRFFLYNPVTSAEQINDCRKFSVGSGYNIPVLFSKDQGKLKIEIEFNKTSTIDTTFDWNWGEGESICYLYNIPIYNPYLVNQRNTKYYPFDDYEMSFGFSFPYATDFQGFVRIPKQFRITNLSINTSQKDVMTLQTINIAYFNFKPIENETQIFSIKFSRLPDLGSLILVGSILFGLPLLLALFFCLSATPHINRTKENRITIFYIAIIPLFISMLPFLSDKPTEFTLFDALMALTVVFLVLNILKDFVFSEKKLFYGSKWRIIISIIVLIVVFAIWGFS